MAEVDAGLEWLELEQSGDAVPATPSLRDAHGGWASAAEDVTAAIRQYSTAT